MKRKFILFLATVVGAQTVLAHEGVKTSATTALNFAENKGQWNNEAKYKAEIPGGVMFLTESGFVYNFIDQKDLEKYHTESDKGNSVENFKFKSHAYKVEFVGSNSNQTIDPAKKLPFYSNYIIDNDKTKWASNVSHYQEVTQRNVYNGIDLKVYSNGESGVKYDFIVSAGGDPNTIKLNIKGVKPELTKDGKLKIKTSVNEIVENAPYSYQIINGEKVEVVSKYKFENGIVSFAFPNGYNKSVPLVIDPELIFATYSGGLSSAFYAHSTTYDKIGNTYTAALGYGIGWPTTLGAYQGVYPGQYCVAVNKYSVNGSALIYSTYFGASTGYTQPNTVRVNDNNELIMAGNTTANNLPMLATSYQSVLKGVSDIYVAKLSANGGTLLASTYIGGQAMEALLIGTTTSYTALGASTSAINPVDIVVDDNGNVWGTSNTASTDFPVTNNAFQATNGGGHDAVLFKLNPNFSSLLYSTYFGGNGWDGGIGLEYNNNNNIVALVGQTGSNNFPTTAGALRTTPYGQADGFALLVNNTAYNVVASTYLGTSAADNAMRIAFDCADNIYVAGRTMGNYPISATSVGATNGSVYIDKLNSNLSASIVSTRTGMNNAYIIPSSMIVDVCGNVLIGTITSSTMQTGMPLTPEAFETQPRAFYFAAFGYNFTSLEFGSYFGGVSNTGGTSTSDHYHPGIARMDPKGILYHSLCASGTVGTSLFWPMTPGSYSEVKMNGGTNDNITFKFNFDAISFESTSESPEGGNDPNTHAIRGCKSAFVTFERSGKEDEEVVLDLVFAGTAVNGVDYALLPDTLVFPPNILSRTIEVKPLLVPQATGPKEAIFRVMAPCNCDGQENIAGEEIVTIYDSLYAKFITPPTTVCPNTEVEIEAEIDNTLNYVWNPAGFNQGSLIIHPSPFTTTTYALTVTQPGAPATCPPRTIYYKVNVEQNPEITFNPRELTICDNGDSLDINGYIEPTNQTYTYAWSPATYLRNTTQLNNKFKAPVGSYELTLVARTQVAGCADTNKLKINVVPPFRLTNVTPQSGTIVDYGKEVKMSAAGAINYTWFPTTLFFDPFLQYNTSSPTKDTEYKVVGVDQYGCKDTANIKIIVNYPEEPIMPNAFTPNGDGKNDVFKLTNAQFQKLITFKIFNRYGNIVFETINPLKGWDGTHNEVASEAGVYFYIIEFELPNGEKRSIKGDVALMR